MTIHWWSPTDADASDDTTELRLSSMTPFGKPVIVLTTRAEVYRLVQRLKAEPAEKVVQLSNETLRFCMAHPNDEPTEEFCGKVLLFHCTRWVRSRQPLPCVDP